MASAQARSESLLTPTILQGISYEEAVSFKTNLKKTVLQMDEAMAIDLGLYDHGQPANQFYDPEKKIAKINLHRVCSESNFIKMAQIVADAPSARSVKLAKEQCNASAIIEAQKRYREGGEANLPSEWKADGILRSAWNETFGKSEGCPFITGCVVKGKPLFRKGTPHFGSCVFNRFMTKEEFEATNDMRDDVKFVVREIADRLARHYLDTKIAFGYDRLTAKLEGMTVAPSASRMDAVRLAQKKESKLIEVKPGDASDTDEEDDATTPMSRPNSERVSSTQELFRVKRKEHAEAAKSRWLNPKQNPRSNPRSRSNPRASEFDQ